MKTLAQYREEIIKQRNNPGLLSQLNLEMAADYAFSSELFGELEIKKAAFFIQKKYSQEKPLSDAACEAFWIASPEGERWNKGKRRLKGLEKLQAAIKSLLYVANQEAHNTY